MVDFHLGHQMGEHGCVATLSGGHRQHQGPAVAVDQGVDFGAQSPAGPADRVIVRFSKQIHVIRRGPCGAGKVGAVLVGTVHR
jgi:hypothetical protein